MKDSRGVTIGVHDVVARKTPTGWRIGRAVIVGYTDASRVQALAMCTDFESHGAGNSWQQVLEPANLQRLAPAQRLGSSPEEMLQRMPELGRTLDDFELHLLAERLAELA